MPARRLRQLHRPWGAGLRAFAATTLVAVALTAGCGGDDDNGLPPPHPGGTASPLPSPAVTLTAQEQEAVDEVRELFDEFMTAYVDLATSGDPPDDEAMAPILQRIDGSLYNEVNLELVDNYLAGKRMSGDLTWELVGILAIDVDSNGDASTDPQLTLSYCLYASSWKLSGDDGLGDFPNHEPVIADAVHLATTTAVHFDRGGSDDPRWYLVELDRGEAAQPC